MRKVPHLCLSLLPSAQFVIAVITLVERNNASSLGGAELFSNGSYGNVGSAFRLIIFARKSDACVWIIQDREGIGLVLYQHTYAGKTLEVLPQIFWDEVWIGVQGRPVQEQVMPKTLYGIIGVAQIFALHEVPFQLKDDGMVNAVGSRSASCAHFVG